MENILHDFNEKVISLMTEFLRNSIIDGGISKFTDDLNDKLMQLGYDLTKFSLEYATRFFKNGAYYIMPSSRGEKEDERHLSQFYHSKVEIAGTLEEVMDIAEKYIKYLSAHILSEYGNQLKKTAGNINHIKNIINMEKFPEVIFEEACNILNNSEKYIKYHQEGFRTINSQGEKN